MILQKKEERPRSSEKKKQHNNDTINEHYFLRAPIKSDVF